jgi:LPXTG-site transpeptidase (sortase) family protein
MRRLWIVVWIGLLVGLLPGATAAAQGGGSGGSVPITEDTFFQLIIPELEVDVAVFEAWQHRRTWAFHVFTEEAGHLQYTAYPGMGGNVVIGAHYELADFEPGPFYTLDALGEGALIEVYFMGELYTYQVVGTDLVSPRDLSILRPTPFEVLTLLTCYDYSPQAATYTQRYIVRAVLVAGPQP